LKALNAVITFLFEMFFNIIFGCFRDWMGVYLYCLFGSKFGEASLLVRGRLSSRQGVAHGLRVHLGSGRLLLLVLFVLLLLQRLLSLVLLLLLERLERLLLHHVDSRLLLLPRPANKLGTWEDGPLVGFQRRFVQAGEYG